MQSLGRWTLIESLGTGSGGSVYAAADDETGKTAAVKIVRSGSTDSSRIEQDLLRLKTMAHPGLVRVLDHGFEQGRLWYAMDCIDAPNLNDWLREYPVSTSLPLRISMALHVASTIAYMHARGLIHGDLKPENILVTKGNRPVLVDLDLARGVRGRDERAYFVDDERVGGSPAFAPPEQFSEGSIDFAFDLYALGCLLFLAATGDLPFRGRASEILLQKRKGIIPDPKSHNPSIPDALSKVITRLLTPYKSYRRPIAWQIQKELSLRYELSPEYRTDNIHVHRPTMLGRETETTALLSFLDEGGRCLITGPSGIGKTFLISEHLSYMRRRYDTSLYQLEKGRIETRGPFEKWLSQKVDQWISLGSSDLRETIGIEPSTVLSLIDARISDLFPGVRAPTEVVSEEGLLLAKAKELVKCILHAKRGRPEILVIDNIQWADDLTKLVLDYLHAEDLAASSFNLILTETKEAGGPLSSISDADHSINLKPLGRSTQRLLISQLTEGLLSLGETTIDRITGAARGNPLYICESVRAHYAINSTLKDSVSFDSEVRNINTIVRARLSTLPQSAQLTASSIAVADNFADLDTLQHMSGLTSAELSSSISLLADSGFIQSGSEGDLRFVHGRHRAAIASTDDPGTRKDLHARLGDILERAPRIDIEAKLMLTRCRKNAGQPHLEFQASLDVAETSFSMKRFADAVTYYSRCIDLVPELSREVDIARITNRLASSQAAIGQNRDAVRNAEKALRLAGFPVPQKQWGPYFVKRLMMHPFAKLNWRLRTSDSRCDLGLDAVTMLAPEYFFQDNLTAGLSICLLSLDIAKANNRTAGPIRCYSALSAFARIAGLERVSNKYLEIGASLRRTVDNSDAAAFLMSQSLMLGIQGKWGESLLRALEAEDLHKNVWDPRSATLIEVLKGHAEYFLGRYPESEATFSRIRDMGEDQENEQTIAWGLFSIARSYCVKGKFDEALPLLKDAVSRFSEQTEAQSWEVALGLMARCELKSGNPQAAITYAKRCSEHLIRAIPSGYPSVEGYAGVLEVLDAYPDRTLQKTILKKFRGFQRVVPTVTPRYEYYRARFSQSEPRAVKHLTAGFEAASIMTLPQERALCASLLMEFGHATSEHHEAVDHYRTLIGR